MTAPGAALPRLFGVGAAVAAALALVLAFVKVVLRPPPGLIAVAAFVLLATFSLLAWASARAVARNPRHPCRRWWLAAAMFAFCFAAVDLGAGMLRPRDEGASMVADERRHHRLVPNQSKTLVERDFTYTVTTNSQGLRGPEIEVPKRSDTTRLLFLGDSFTMGQGVEEPETYVRLVETRLRQRADGRRYEVVNGGIDSYAPLLSRLLLEEIIDIAPDHVIHALDMSDLLQEQAYRNIAVRDAGGRIVAVRPDTAVDHDLARRASNWLMQHTIMTSLVLQKLHDDTPVTVNNFVRRANAELLRYTLAGDTVDRTQQWDDMFDSIRETAEICRSRGIRYSLVIYPWGHQVSDREWRSGRADFMEPGARASDDVRAVIAERAAAAGIRLIDTIDHFRKARSDVPLYWDNDMHWTPAGHVLMAEALLARLEI